MTLFAMAFRANSGVAMGGGVAIATLAITVLLIVAVWKIFVKAGHPGWASLIPLYNAYVLLKIAGKPGWWLLLLFIPFVNFIVLFLVSVGIAKAFGRSAAFGIVLLLLLGGIGYLILGFGSAQYRDLKASATTSGA